MEPTRRRLIYLVSEGLPPTVIDAQVVAVLARLAERGLVFDLFIYQLQSPRPEWNVRQRLEEIRQRLPGRVRLWPWPAQTRRETTPIRSLVSPPRGANEGRSTIRDTFNRAGLEAAHVALQALVLTDTFASIRRREPIILHARGGAIELALRLKRWYPGFRVVADIRGDAIAEYEYEMQRRGLALESDAVRRGLSALAATERRFVLGADSVQCVSFALRRRLEATTGIPSGRVRVVPCLADERLFRFDAAERVRRREDLGVVDRTVLVYSGSLLSWQNGDALLKLFARLRDQLPALHLLLLSPDRQAASELLRRCGLTEGDGVTVRSARYAEVPGYLSAADLGLLLRDPHPLNRVASPTKFAEYALCGLPVLASRGIGDLDEIIRSHGLGETVGEDPAEVESAVRARVAAPELRGAREARSGRAGGILALALHIDALTAEYATLGRHPSST